MGIVTVLADDTSAVLDVLGIGGGRRFHTGRMAVPGGVTYLVVTPPAGSGGVTAALGGLCARYDPRMVVLLTGGLEDVAITSGPEPVDGAVTTFFAAAGEPATLPGYGGAPPFPVFRRVGGDAEVARFCAGATTLRGKPLAWAVVRGGAERDAAQALRYLIPYLRPRL